MHCRWLKFINNRKFILGSSSIPRKQLLDEMGVIYEVIVSNFPENLPKTDPKSYVESTCRGKLNSIVNDNPQRDIDILVTSDTILDMDGIILEKAENEKVAKEWLISYSSKQLRGLTSVCIALIHKIDGINIIYDQTQFTEEVLLDMSYIDEEIAEFYIETGEWKNRAGALGIHLKGKVFIKKVNGDPNAMVGLPVSAFSVELSKILERNFKL